VIITSGGPIIEKVGGHYGAKKKVGGTNINVYPA